MVFVEGDALNIKGNDYYDVYVFDTRMMELFESVDKDLYIKTNKLTF